MISRRKLHVVQRLDTSAQLGRNPKEQEPLVENVVEMPLKKDAVDRKKVKWSDTIVEVFLKICIEEVLAGNRYDTHFTKIGWATVIEKFNEATNLTYEYKELRKKWDNLKKEWALWTKLVGRDTGLGRNAAKKTISASDEWWEAKIQENPKVAKLRKHGPKYWLQMEILFRDIVDSGSVEYAPPKDSRVPEGIPKGIEGMHVDDNKKDDNDQERVFETETGITSQPTCSSSSNNARSANDAISISACVDKLKNLPGLELGSELFFLGTRLLKDRANRLIFVALEDPTLQVGWIKSHTWAGVR